MTYFNEPLPVVLAVPARSALNAYFAAFLASASQPSRVSCCAWIHSCAWRSGDADPYSGYDVRVDGQNTVIGGTSAVAPLWAGFIARVNAAKGSPVGYLNPLLYRNANTAGAFRDITQGNNGDFAAAAGWDACTGLGSPGPKLADVLIAAQSAAQA